MRTLMLAVMAALMALVVPVAADAKGYRSHHYHGKTVHKRKASAKKYYGKKKHHARRHASGKRYASGKRHIKRQAASHRRSGRRYASQRSSRMKGRHFYAASGSSRSCLTGQAQALLGRIEARFGRVQIISTCRPGARIATTGKISKHASGQAIDFRVPGRKREVVQWLIANHRSGGTMTYSDMDHIHVDVGYHFVALNRPSGRG